MRHSFLYWLTIASVASLSLTMTSCTDPDEISDSKSLTAKLQANKWIYKDASYGEGSGSHAWVDVETTTLYFTTNNTGVVYWVQKDYDTDLGNSTTKEYVLFDYSVSGNTVTIKDEKNYVTTYTYQEGCLVSGSSVYLPSAMSSSDYEFARKLGPQTGSCGSNLQYSFDDRTGELTISGSGRMNDYSGTNQPWHNFAINKIIIEKGCTSVGSHAFYKLKYKVDKIELANTIEEIGDYAFCDLLIDELSVPMQIVKIGDCAFTDCTCLKSVSFAGCDALEEIGEWAFASCPIRTNYFTVPKNVRKIGSYAFWLTEINSSLTLNEKLESVGNSAFHKLNISKLEIPNSVNYIGAVAFLGSFSEIRIGTGLRTLGEVPFASSKSGKMYVNLGQPLPISPSTYIIMNTNADGLGVDVDAASLWTLYVPKGSKSAYQNATGWKSFKSIIEDSSLVSGNGTPQGSGGGGQGDSHSGTHNGHEYVDLGLSVKWATCNIGATKPEEYGGYYAWGETEEKNYYGVETYKYYESDYVNIGNDIAGTQYDVAHVKWGGSWCMPSKEQVQEFCDKCSSEWTTKNGKKGRLFTGPNGATIFLPAAGCRHGSDSSGWGMYGYYWSSSYYRSMYYPYYGDWAYALGFGPDANDYDCSNYGRDGGRTVRPVCP